MTEKFESRFNKLLLLWLLPIGLLILVPMIMFFYKIREGFYSWEVLAYYFILPVFACLSLLVISNFLQNKAPKIIITPDLLKIAGRSIPFDHISKIRLFSNNISVSESSTIILKNGEEFVLGISLYKNGSEIRENLKRIKSILNIPDSNIILQQQLPPVRTYKIKDFSGFKKYKKTVFSSLIPYLLFLMILFFFYLFLVNPSLPALGIFLFFGGMFGFIIIFQASYYLISEEYLTIKNAFIPFWQQTYKRTDIIKIDHIYGYKSADGIKLTFSNFKTKGFLSGFLNSSMFSELEENLRRGK